MNKEHQQPQTIYFPLDVDNTDRFFEYLRASLSLEEWKKSTRIEIEEDALTILKKIASKETTIETCNLECLTFKYKKSQGKTDKADILYDPTTKIVVEVGFGRHSEKNTSRDVFKSYRRKKVTRILVIYLKGKNGGRE